MEYEMAIKMEELEKEALKLPSHERATIALSLIRSLDKPEDVDEKEIEHLWIEEAKKRYTDYKQGKTTIKTADQVFHEVRSRKR